MNKINEYCFPVNLFNIYNILTNKIYLTFEKMLIFWWTKYSKNSNIMIYYYNLK